jgi:tetratricopeptide (TPR) repeat protein
MALECFNSALNDLGQIQENNEETKEISELDAGFAMVYHNKGYTYGSYNQYEQALQCLDNAISRFKKAIDKKKDITRYKTEYVGTLRIKGYIMAAMLKEQNPQIQKIVSSLTIFDKHTLW